MRNLFTFVVITMILLTGCGSNESIFKIKNQKHPVAHAAMIDSFHFNPKATIVISPITLQSTNATISTVDRKVDVSEIIYHIWRTADGKGSIRLFTSNNKDMNFSCSLDIKEFKSERGEYQVAAYGVQKNGKLEFLAKSDLTFQQYVPILMYHAIDDYKGTGLKELFVTPVNFESQMRYLKDNGYTFLTFEHFDEINKVNKPVLVTFDDGMKNNYLNAYRILQKFKNAEFKPIATEFMIADKIDNGSNSLSSSDLKEMVNSDIFSIQSHTMSHADLRTVTNYEKELNASKERIEQVTGKPIIAISYPSGRFNSKVLEETKKYYHFAVTTKPGQFIENGEPDEMFTLHRVRISNSTTINQFAYLVRQK